MKIRWLVVSILLLAVAPLCGCDDDEDAAAGPGCTFQHQPAALAVPGSQPGDPAPYWEETCDDLGPLADLSDLEQQYHPDCATDFAVAASDRRYPACSPGIAMMTPEWLQEVYPTFGDFLGSMPLNRCHEGMHLWSIFNQGSGKGAWYVRPDLVVEVEWIDYYPLADIIPYHNDPELDFFFDVYLREGSPTGLPHLLAELNSYTHQTGMTHCLRDHLPDENDEFGAITFMYYTQLYLKVGSENHAAAYGELVGKPELVDDILLLWDRADFWVKTALYPVIGSANAPYNEHKLIALKSWVEDPDNLQHIDALRALQ